ncbi:MAG: GspH/FimT family pseudopilin [Nitrospiria bacterium]
MLELVLVLGIIAVAGTIAWPRVAALLQDTELSAATRTLLSDIRWARLTAQTQGRIVEMRFDPGRSLYTINGAGHVPGRVVRLSRTLSFGSPLDPEADGVTFRDDAITFSTRAGLQNSFGSVMIRTQTSLARKITVNIAGYASVSVWDGVQWR